MFLYPLLPWIGVMLLGFGDLGVFELPPERRNSVLAATGLGHDCGVRALRALDVYGDPNPWERQPGGLVATVIDFLNTTKYPPSLDFLLMTLGPAAILCGLADRTRGLAEGRADHVRPRAVRLLRRALLS